MTGSRRGARPAAELPVDEVVDLVAGGLVRHGCAPRYRAPARHWLVRARAFGGVGGFWYGRAAFGALRGFLGEHGADGCRAAAGALGGAGVVVADTAADVAAGLGAAEGACLDGAYSVLGGLAGGG
ncbi:hypothetical protein IU450_27955 [Nocardia abscessus]|uniref:hypothetical protein n=1 Tax=Nocardia abscessus TaxID=120957 RepID=UPI00189571BF|nr:hypothetical protein [Nocardia abscessus]MBF6339698.1 hypothetical protein [Nocardia abscessus]